MYDCDWQDSVSFWNGTRSVTNDCNHKPFPWSNLLPFDPPHCLNRSFRPRRCVMNRLVWERLCCGWNCGWQAGKPWQGFTGKKNFKAPSLCGHGSSILYWCLHFYEIWFRNVGNNSSTFTLLHHLHGVKILWHRITSNRVCQTVIMFHIAKFKVPHYLISFVQRCNQRSGHFRRFGLGFFFPEYNAIANSGLVGGALAHGIVDPGCFPPFHRMADWSYSICCEYLQAVRYFMKRSKEIKSVISIVNHP